MSDSLFDRERTALAKLRALITARASAEGTIAGAYQGVADEAEKEVGKARRQIASARAKARTEADANYQEHISAITARYDARQSAADNKRARDLQIAQDNFDDHDEKARTAYKDRLWTIDSLFEAGEKEIADELQKNLRKAEGGRRRGETSWSDVTPFLARVGLDRAAVSYPEDRLPAATPSDPDGMMTKSLEAVERAAEHLQAAFLPKLLSGGGTAGLAILAGAVFAGIGFAMLPNMYAAILAVVGALVGGLLLRQVFLILARRQVRDRGASYGVFQSEAARGVRLFEEFVKAGHARQKSELTRRHLSDTKRTDDHFKPVLTTIKRTKETEFEQIESEHDDKTAQIANDRATEGRAADAEYEGALVAVDAKSNGELAVFETRYAGKMSSAMGRRNGEFDALSHRWLTGIDEVRTTLADVTAFGAAHFPPWAAITSGKHPLTTTVPQGIRFGETNIDMYALPEGEPLDARLTPAKPVRDIVPAYLPFPDKASVLIKADDRGRPAAVATVQAMMLRFLTGLPPGKVRFTIIDPVGLGENFAAFMHLADYDEKLVGARIWTEPSQIDQRLTDLTEHMENVIQKYLRNQYRSIEDYNRQAGEVAEPYRVLVIANFPTNFTPDAARRLISIMSSGPACGVCTLVSVDAKAPLPRDFRLADLEQVAFNLHWKEGKFVPVDADLSVFPLTLDAPPDPQETAQIVRRVGEASRDAGRVEVPFDFIMPKAEEIWAGDAAKGFAVPVGRSGATKRQMFILGRGTAQHALIAGKTGSGKSTLLHALITNLALHYGPDQAELYLIDFKKGVEFKMYAAEGLPHARVVAIESEREFGLSVLQRLDGILRERGDAFRQVGANDLAGYRESTGTTLPRILFVVDEFQEFFVEDDKLAQESSLLLDRLVRQGRAFGLHVLLGSQTLGGAYSLARSTIDQMAVRIALQCSDADAQLILSKDNTAARLLSRPGEAIYNDANGLVEGNDPFQVVWLPEERREQLLREMHARAAGKYPPPLVFEGNLPAVVSENCLLKEISARPPAEPKAVTAWLGDAIAIKDPTSAVFRATSGSNLLLIGQQEEAALACVTASIVSLAAACRAPGSLTILDGTPDDAEHAEYLRKATTALGITSSFIERPNLTAAFNTLADELAMRLSGETADRSPKFLVVFGLSRFRELRKAEDDFGFGRKSDGPKPAGELFAAILRDGPAVGIHSVIWCDSLTNFTRGLDRQALREFGQRVLFQMSATDSSHLIDTPAANKLDRNRALFTLDDQPRPEKFRPYGLPEMTWLTAVGERIKVSSSHGIGEPHA